MTSWRSSSSLDAGAALALLAAAALAAGCAHPGEAQARRAGGANSGGPAPDWRIAVFPVTNLSGTSIPFADTQAALERSLARAADLVTGDAVERFLARRRVRYTGGMDGPTAEAAADDLGVEAALFTSVDLYDTAQTPRFAISMRLVSTTSAPLILWADAVALSGDDAPGAFNLGLVRDVSELERRALSRLAASLKAFLDGKATAAERCVGGRRYEPRIYFHATRPVAGEQTRIAVLPFVNETGRRDAGELLTLHFVRMLASSRQFRVLDPGVVRAALLRNHVVMEGGVTHEAARIALATMDADVVLAGYVRTYDDGPVPRVEFTVIALATWDNRIVWESTSYNRGDEDVFFFGLGRESTADALACRMVRATSDRMAADWPSSERADEPYRRRPVRRGATARERR